jgi:hypothetical protein
MSKWTLAAVAFLAVGGIASAQPITSGPQAGQKVPGPFAPLHTTGPDAGQRVCLYCKNGVHPVAMIFAREVSPAVVTLIKKIDAATVAHSDVHMGSFATFLNDSSALPAALKQVAEQERIQTTILCVADPAGPPSYKIAADADVTVILYTHRTVKANYAFRKGELNEQAVNAIVGDVAKILPAE